MSPPTVRLPHHRFETTPFWKPWCVLCHERRRHPVHYTTGVSEVCGYQACQYCEERNDPQRGMEGLKK